MRAGNTIGEIWKKNGRVLKLEIATNQARIEVAETIRENLEDIGIQTTIRSLSNSYYKNNLEELNYQILLTGNTVSIKPLVQEYLDFEIEQKETEEATYQNIYKKYNENPNFIGLYFDSIILLYSNSLKGNLEGNWYNIFYNINTWYKIIE